MSWGEEPVCFVENDHADALQAADGVGAGGVDVVGETAGRGDHDVWALCEGHGLWAHVGAAGDEEGFHALGGGDGFDLFVDLEGKFTRHIGLDDE